MEAARGFISDSQSTGEHTFFPLRRSRTSAGEKLVGANPSLSELSADG